MSLTQNRDHRSTSRRTRRSYIIVGVVLAVGLIFLAPTLYRFLTSRSFLEATLAKMGPWGVVGLALLNIVQVIVAPIPGGAVNIAGGYVLGPTFGSLGNVAGVVMGSFLSFGLVRHFGSPLVTRLVSSEVQQKLEQVTYGRGLAGLSLLFLVPISPHDALCLLMGLTPIGWRAFSVLVLCRIPTAIIASLAGAEAAHLLFS